MNTNEEADKTVSGSAIPTLTEGEREPRSGDVLELNLEQTGFDRSVLSDQLIHARDVEPPRAVGRDVGPSGIAGLLAIEHDAERAAIVQCYHNDLTHEEAAYVLNCPVGTVKTHVLRGKQKLKAALGAYAP